MKISEIITDRYKLRIPPTVYYELLADVQEVEEEQEPTTKNDLGVDCVSRQEVLRLLANSIGKTNTYLQTKVLKMSSVTPQNQVYPLCEDCHTKMDEVRRAYDNAMKQEPILDKLRAEMKPYTDPKGFIVIGENRFNMILDRCKAESEDV